MSFFVRFVFSFGAVIVLSYVLTIVFRKLAKRLNWVDRPSLKKLHKYPLPTMGGICVYLAFWVIYFLFIPSTNQLADVFAIFFSSTIILLTGVIDDLYELKPWQKMTGILLGANILYFFTNIRVDSLTIDWIGTIQFNQFSYLVMMLWIASITNSVNLMDGLDGLATGTSIISLTTMGLVSYFFTNSANVSSVVIIFLLVGSLIGFLPHNFYPAKIFLGDTGSLFVGFMIATLSLNGLKHATFISLLIPVAILGVPITDTIAAVIRRLLHKKAISKKDWGHLHHRLLRLGFSHKQTVLVIYAMGIIFSLTALLYPLSSFLGVVILTIGLVFGMILFVVSFNLLDSGDTPFRRSLYKLLNNPDDQQTNQENE